MLKNKKGFTLIELLIVIAIIAIIAAVVIVALDPATRFKDARDAVRASDVEQLANAIKVDQVDNGGTYHANITGLTSGSVYVIVNGATMVAGCDDNNASCDTNVTADTSCADLSFLTTEGYLGELPVSPAGAVTWDDGSVAGNEGTGYTISYNSTTGTVTLRSCESENTTEISVAQ
ncbi:MAG: prepilin-type N-terminal cleavage/methylation domain-containing protein [Patescibacteria group bacterium]